jgi:hypothetical protein
MQWTLRAAYMRAYMRADTPLALRQSGSVGKSHRRFEQCEGKLLAVSITILQFDRRQGNKDSTIPIPSVPVKNYAGKAKKSYRKSIKFR